MIEGDWEGSVNFLYEFEGFKQLTYRKKGLEATKRFKEQI
jgi:hypothetical protein